MDAIGISDGRFVAVGSAADVMRSAHVGARMALGAFGAPDLETHMIFKAAAR